jgi:hypothetical protein
MVERRARRDEVEARVRKRHRSGVALDPAHVRRSRFALGRPGLIEHARCEIETGYFADMRSELE